MVRARCGGSTRQRNDINGCRPPHKQTKTAARRKPPPVGPSARTRERPTTHVHKHGALRVPPLPREVQRPPRAVHDLQRDHALRERRARHLVLRQRQEVEDAHAAVLFLRAAVGRAVGRAVLALPERLRGVPVREHVREARVRAEHGLRGRGAAQRRREAPARAQPDVAPARARLSPGRATRTRHAPEEGQGAGGLARLEEVGELVVGEDVRGGLLEKVVDAEEAQDALCGRGSAGRTSGPARVAARGRTCFSGVRAGALRDVGDGEADALVDAGRGEDVGDARLLDEVERGGLVVLRQGASRGDYGRGPEGLTRSPSTQCRSRGFCTTACGGVSVRQCGGGRGTDGHHAEGADEGAAGVPELLGRRLVLPRVEGGAVDPRLGEVRGGELALEVLGRGGDEGEQGGEERGGGHGGDVERLGAGDAQE